MIGKKLTYLSLLKKGEIRSNTMKVLKYISEHSGTDIGLMRMDLDMPHQTLTPALSKLMDAGLVRENGFTTRANEVHYSCLWFEDDDLEQDSLSAIRMNENFRKWVKRGIKDFNGYLPSNVLKDLREFENQMELKEV